MKYFAQLNNLKIVVDVIQVTDEKDSEWLTERLGGEWVETSETIRKNYAGIGMTYDSELDAFIGPQPFDSWILDEETAQWEAPVEYPTDGKAYSWDEESTSWVEIPQDEE